MNTEPQKRATEPIHASLKSDITRAFNDRFFDDLGADQISIHAAFGDQIVYFRAEVGNAERAHVFEAYLEDQPSALEEGLGLLMDFMAESLAEFFVEERNAFFPIDFVPFVFESKTLYARHEYRNFAAEILANQLLDAPLKPH